MRGAILKSIKLEIKNKKLQETINDFLSALLEKKLLDAILVPLELPSGNMLSLTLVSDSEKLAKANVLAPVMPVSGARVVSKLTKSGLNQKKIGVVLRACELRALVELVKLKQASLNNLILIGVDCFGTYSMSTYSKFCQETSKPTDEFLNRIKQGNDSNLREACQVCTEVVSPCTDMLIELFGMDLEHAIRVSATSPAGEKILESLGLELNDKKTEREKTLAELTAVRAKNREQLISRFEKDAKSLEGLQNLFASCTGCHNCRVACPICYCRECFLDSRTFDLDAADYLKQSDNKGALRMPSDNLLYHLTRLYHVGASCVNCGLCQDACPNDISLFPIFCASSTQVQKTFNYVPGKSVEENVPLSVFNEDEFGEIEK